MSFEIKKNFRRKKMNNTQTSDIRGIIVSDFSRGIIVSDFAKGMLVSDFSRGIIVSD